MGCVGSKPEDSPAVILCRKRCEYLDEAIHQRYTLSQAHLAYFLSLKSVGDSLHLFYGIYNNSTNSTGGEKNNVVSPPVLNLPSQRKGEKGANSVSLGPPHVRSNSGSSHLHFHTDSDSDSDDSPLHLHDEKKGDFGDLRYYDKQEAIARADNNNNNNNNNPYAYPYPSVGYSAGGNDYLPAGYPTPSFPYTMNFMKKQPTQSVMYQQKPISSEPIYYSSSNANDNYGNLNPSNYSYNNNYSNYGEFFGSSLQQVPPRVVEAEAEASSSKAPPPPPPVAASSGWDFFNPFESYESFYPPYTTSRDSSIVREEEGIPDLEDEDFYQNEVVKEVDRNQKFVDGGGGDGKKAEVVDEVSEERTDVNYRSVPNMVAKEEDNSVEYEVHVVDKEVVENPNKSVVFDSDSDVMKEIRRQFDRASDSGNELAKILEVGKVPHNRKHAAYQVPSKMLNVFTPSSALSPADPDILDTEVDLLTKSKNLSSTLHKLYLWEKKLFDEVKIEEKMRLLHEEKKRRLVRMDEKGSEPHKIDATRTFVRSLSTKIRIAIQVVDKISEKINHLRDEELWPQLNDFIEGLTGMWRSMVECHHSQFEAINAAKHIDAIASHKHSSDASLEATMQLEHELLNWAIRFSCWFQAQKGFVRALNEWLLKCLMYEPEVTVDGPVPYSPGRLGAPPIFVVLNQWAQAMQRISDKEVVDSMRDFATTVLQLWERDKVEMRHRMVVDKSNERNVKNLDKEDQKIHKELQMLDKMIVVASGNDDNKGMSLGHAVYQSQTSKNGSLQTSLQRVFESMERFTSMSLKTYEELLKRIEEDKLAR